MVLFSARGRALRLVAQRLGRVVPDHHGAGVGAGVSRAPEAWSPDLRAAAAVSRIACRPTIAASGLAAGVVVLALCAATVPPTRPPGHPAAARPVAHAVRGGVDGAVAVAAVGAVSSSAAAPSAPSVPGSAAAPSPSAAASPAPSPRASAPTPASVAPVSALALSGMPVTALQAYRNAAAREALVSPTCHLPWPLLAGIGRVESNHGRFAGAVLHSDGVSTPAIIGIPLNGHGTEPIRDTDHGRLDGDTVWDRAVGPMQFIPSTWAGWGVDGNHDGRKDPFNVYDAAAAAADYLCAAGRDLSTAAGQVRAVLSYNHSDVYVRTVLGLEKIYAAATGVTVPILPTTPGKPTPSAGHEPPSGLPPVDPGPPRGVTPPRSPSPSRSRSPSRSPSSSSPSSSAASSSAPASSPPASSSPASSPVTSPASSPVSLRFIPGFPAAGVPAGVCDAHSGPVPRRVPSREPGLVHAGAVGPVRRCRQQRPAPATHR